MGKRQYPRLGQQHQHGKAKPCVVCGEPTRTTVDVQYTWMRGDDDVARVCKAHRNDLAAIRRKLEGGQ